MKKNLPLIVLGLCLVYWGILAVIRVSAQSPSMTVNNGSIMSSGGGIVGVVITTTTTTTTIPASTTNLIGNSIVDYNWDLYPENWQWPWVIVGEGGWGYSARGDHRDHWYSAFYGTPGVENAMQQTVSNLVSGATYELQFQLKLSSSDGVNGFWPYIGGTKGTFVSAVDGVYTQRLVAGSTNTIAIWYEDGNFGEVGSSVDNVYMYYVSGP